MMVAVQGLPGWRDVSEGTGFVLVREVSSEDGMVNSYQVCVYVRGGGGECESRGDRRQLPAAKRKE